MDLTAGGMQETRKHCIHDRQGGGGGGKLGEYSAELRLLAFPGDGGRKATRIFRLLIALGQNQKNHLNLLYSTLMHPVGKCASDINKGKLSPPHETHTTSIALADSERSWLMFVRHAGTVQWIDVMSVASIHVRFAVAPVSGLGREQSIVVSFLLSATIC